MLIAQGAGLLTGIGRRFSTANELFLFGHVQNVPVSASFEFGEYVTGPFMPSWQTAAPEQRSRLMDDLALEAERVVGCAKERTKQTLAWLDGETEELLNRIKIAPPWEGRYEALRELIQAAHDASDHYALHAEKLTLQMKEMSGPTTVADLNGALLYAKTQAVDINGKIDVCRKLTATTRRVLHMGPPEYLQEAELAEAEGMGAVCNYRDKLRELRAYLHLITPSDLSSTPIKLADLDLD